MKIQILDEAQQDLIDGYHFYESQSPGLGDYFLDSLYSDIESLKFYAGIHSLHHGYHRLLAKRFPFAIYYRVQHLFARVQAGLGCRRDPSWIRDRAAERRGEQS